MSGKAPPSPYSELVIDKKIEPLPVSENLPDPDMEIKHKVLDYEMSSFILESAKDVKDEVLNIEKKRDFGESGS